MKTLIVIFVVILFAGCADAQKIKEDKVPVPAVSALHKLYPDLKDYDWYNEDGNYEAEYELSGMEAAVTFDVNGNVVETEKEIPVNSLPASVTEYISKNYSGAKIKEATEITDAKGAKMYEAEIKGKDVVFDANGNFVKEEKD
ncbi:MAG TPA: PepSY-like domain-containing protein [Chitinophagales bacterium]|nr:PepSY-like domain-containing protein [Chitinophagales bacterium]